jgi:hypothetical protein
MLTRTGFAILAVSTLGAATLWACGPYFPPWLLGNEAGMLDAPMTWLRDSLAPLLPPGKTVPVAPMAVDGPSPSEQTARADAADLKGALEELKTPTDRREALLEQYRQARKAMTENPKTTVTAPAGLPGEMDDYLRGAIAWHEERFADARGIWEKLLARPAAERRRRTVWAAFMIGKANLRLDPAKAAPWFQRTRELSGQGFPDPLGLAASSFGWEARAAIAQKRPAEALPLYLQQMAAGDPTAINSIRFTSRKLLADPKALAQAANPHRLCPLALGSHRRRRSARSRAGQGVARGRPLGRRLEGRSGGPAGLDLLSRRRFRGGGRMAEARARRCPDGAVDPRQASAARRQAGRGGDPARAGRSRASRRARPGP